MSTPVKASPLRKIAVSLLWLLSGMAGLAAVYAIYQLSLLIFALVTNQGLNTTGQYYTGVLVGQVTALLGGAIWLVDLIWTGEYALKHSGEPRVLKIFAYILGIEAVLIIIAWLLNLL